MNKKTIAFLVAVGLLLLFVFFSRTVQAPEVTNDIKNSSEIQTPTHDEAELVGLAFIQDVILVAPPNSDPYAAARIYEALSSSARHSVAESFISADIARFVGIQDVPDAGVSVEDLQIINDTQVTLVLGLNYTGTRALRAINMIVEGSEWKVDSVDVLSVYPPEEPVLIPGTPSEPTIPVLPNDCQVAGCSSQLCVDSSIGDIITTCEWREEYACYQTATCERQTDGQCGWTLTEELQACLVDSDIIQ